MHYMSGPGDGQCFHIHYAVAVQEHPLLTQSHSLMLFPVNRLGKPIPRDTPCLDLKNKISLRGESMLDSIGPAIQLLGCLPGLYF